MFKHSRSDSSRVVRGILERMPASNKVLHSLRSPSADAQIDHVVVSPCGIFAINVVRARGTVKVRKDTLWLGGNDLIDTCISAQRKAGEVGKFMRHAVTPVLCFVDAILPAPVIHMRHVVVCTPAILRDYINGGPRCLDQRSVQLLADRAAALGRGRSTTAITSAPLPPPGTAPPRRPKPPAIVTPTPRRRRFLGHQIIGTAIGTAVCIVGAWAVPALAHLTDRGVDQFVHATEHSKPAGALLAPPSTTVSLGAVVVDNTEGTTEPVPPAAAADPIEATVVPPPPSAPVLPELLPTLDFTCPAPGQGWTASPVATLPQSDHLGYHLWYATSAGLWQYWGVFKSGIEAPSGLTGVVPGGALDVRMDRTFHPNAAGAPTMLTFTAPDQPC